MKVRQLFGSVIVVALLSAMSLTAEARDTRHRFPIADAMAAAQKDGRLDGSVKFYWGDQHYPSSAKVLGTFTANKKTNFFNKSDKEGCEWAWLSAMLTLQNRAKSEGGNAVVNVHSVYRNETFSSRTEYECGAGAIMGGVALSGTVVKLP